MRGSDIRRQGRLLHREAMILTRNEDATGVEILHGMIRAVMAELHFDGFRTDREPQDLVTETDTKHRQVRLQNPARGIDCVVTGLRIAGAVGKKHTIRIQGNDLFRAGLRGHHGDAATIVGEDSEDVAFDTEVISRDVHPLVRADRRARIFRPDAAFIPLEAALRGDDLGQIHALQTWKLARQLDGGGLIHFLAGHDAAGLRTLLAQNACQLARVHAGDRDDLAAFEKFRQ